MSGKDDRGVILKNLREKVGLTDAQLAAMLGVSETSVSLYQSGKRSPRPAILEKMAEIFQVPIEYLMGKTTSSFNIVQLLTDQNINISLYEKEMTMDDRLKILQFIIEHFVNNKK